MIPPRSACKDDAEWLECCRMNFAAAALAEVPDPMDEADAPRTARLAYAIADAMMERHQFLKALESGGGS